MPVDELPPWLSGAVRGLASGNVQTWMDMFTENAVHEFPFATSGGLQRLEGKEAIRTFMNNITKNIHFGTLSDIQVRETGEEVVIEAEGHHRDAATGAPFDLRYVWIITHRDGRVTRLRDYVGPRRPRNEEN